MKLAMVIRWIKSPLDKLEKYALLKTTKPEEPWKTGYVECWSCGYEWVAASPASVAIFECPECRHMLGAEAYRTS
jgi:hypothetical protein